MFPWLVGWGAMTKEEWKKVILNEYLLKTSPMQVTLLGYEVIMNVICK